MKRIDTTPRQPLSFSSISKVRFAAKPSMTETRHAIHELAHAVMMTATNMFRVREISLLPRPGNDQLAFVAPGTKLYDKPNLMTICKGICTLIAGKIAEFLHLQALGFKNCDLAAFGIEIDKLSAQDVQRAVTGVRRLIEAKQKDFTPVFDGYANTDFLTQCPEREVVDRVVNDFGIPTTIRILKMFPYKAFRSMAAELVDLKRQGKSLEGEAAVADFLTRHLGPDFDWQKVRLELEQAIDAFFGKTSP